MAELPILQEETIPSFEELKSGFEIIQSMDVKGMKYEKLKSLILKQIKLLPSWIIHPNKENQEKDLRIFRIRKANGNEFDISRWDSFSHPLPEDTLISRANINGHPVLYASNSPATAIFECEIKPNEEFYLSEWSFNTQKSRLSIISTLPENKNSLWYKLTLNTEAKLDQVNRLYGAEGRKCLAYLFKNISQLFLEPRYELTSTIAHHALYDSRTGSRYHADAIVYPSLKSEYDSANYAIHPSLIGTAVIPKYVFKVKLNSIESEGFNISYSSVGQIREDKFEWFDISYRFKKAIFIVKNHETEYVFNEEQIWGEKININDEQILMSKFLSSNIQNAVQEALQEVSLSETITSNSRVNQQIAVEFNNDRLQVSTTSGHFLQIEKIEVNIMIEFK